MVNYLGKYTSSSHAGYGTIGFPRDFVCFSTSNVFFSTVFSCHLGPSASSLWASLAQQREISTSVAGGAAICRRVAAVVEGRHREHTLFLLAPAEICEFEGENKCVLVVVVVVVDRNNLSHK